VTNSNTGNGTGTGQPGTGYPRAVRRAPTARRRTSVDDCWSTYRFYTANYMNWYYSNGERPSPHRIAQDIITDVDANPRSTSGLAVFNRN
jgi:hypothetical protein